MVLVVQPNMRYLTFIGHTQSANPVQVRVILANAASSSAGLVTISIFPAAQLGRRQWAESK